VSRTSVQLLCDQPEHMTQAKETEPAGAVCALSAAGHDAEPGARLSLHTRARAGCLLVHPSYRPPAVGMTCSRHASCSAPLASVR
jgi:hypothetical protein